MTNAEASSLITLATALVSLTYSVVQGPLRNVGWVRQSGRLLDLSDKLGDSGAEGVARRFLRDEAVMRVLKAKRFKESASSNVCRVLNRTGIAGLLALMALCPVLIVQVWLGCVSMVASIAYVAALATMCISSIGTSIARAIQKRRMRQIESLREPAHVNDRKRRIDDDERHDKPDNEGKRVEQVVH